MSNQYNNNQQAHNTRSGHPEPLPLEENRRGAVPHALESHYEKRQKASTYKRKSNSKLKHYQPID